MLQGNAIQELHSNKGLAVLLADVVDCADIRMVQSGGRLRLAPEAGKRLGVTGNFVGQELEGDKAMQPRVFGFVHHTHAPAPDLFKNAVVGYGLADHWPESYVCGTRKSMHANRLIAP